MAYQFHIDGEIYTGRTIPGAARVRLFYPESNRFLAAFLPDNGSLHDGSPGGDWVDVPADTRQDLLKRLKPQVVSACLARRRYIDRANQSKG